jgi:prophage maintenance system killer protein
MSNLLDNALQDFPRSEIWRVQTDGWQASLGPDNFRQAYYQGMDAGFNFLRLCDGVRITPELIEKIYFSSYQYEPAFSDHKICRKGYCEELNEFPIVLPLPGLEPVAGISLAGIDEFIAMLKTTYDLQGSRLFPQNLIGVTKIGEIYPKILNLKNYTSLENFKMEFIKQLELASASQKQYLGPIRVVDDKLTKVEIISNPASREEILGFVQNDIDKYYAELEHAKSIAEPEHRKTAEIMAINGFIRKLHQSHYFPDGNGRTFIFLLANLLHLQNGHGLKITEYPAHFAGFSSQELLVETQANLEHFNAFKISAAKDYFGSLTSEAIIGDKQGTKAELLNQLNPNPLIALAQLDELFNQVVEKRVQVPRGYEPSTRLSKRAIKLLKGPSTAMLAHEHAQIILKELYLQTLARVVESDAQKPEPQRIGYGSKNQTPVEILRSMVMRHMLASECGAGKIEPIISRLSRKVNSVAECSSSAPGPSTSY